MANLTTKALRRRIGIHYNLPPRPGQTTPRWATHPEVEAEYLNLVRKGPEGVCGDARREALRNLFVRWGRDPFDPTERVRLAKMLADKTIDDGMTWPTPLRLK